MNYKVGIIIAQESDLAIMNEAKKILTDYEISFEVFQIDKNNIEKNIYAISKAAYTNGIRVIIAGTRGDANFSNSVQSFFNIPTIGIPCRSENFTNNLESIFSVLQQPNEHAVANVAFDSGQNAAILAVQILALDNKILQNKIIAFKENLKNKILKANEELSQIKFEYKTN